MYAVSILLKNSALSQSFYFDHFATADECYNTVLTPSPTAEFVIVEDEYNSKGKFRQFEISGVSFTDIKRDMDKQGAMELMRQKAIAKAQRLAQSGGGLGILPGGVNHSALLNGN